MGKVAQTASLDTPVNKLVCIIEVSRWKLPTFVAHNFPGVYNKMAFVNTGKLGSFILFCSHYVLCEKHDQKNKQGPKWFGAKLSSYSVRFVFTFILVHQSLSAIVLFICIMQNVCSCLWSLEGGWKFPSICCTQCSCFEQSHT